MRHLTRNEFLTMARAPQGAIAIISFFVSRLLLDDSAFDFLAYQQRKAEEAARLQNPHHTPRCVYTYVPPEEAGYDPGPFPTCNPPTDRMCVVAHVRVTIPQEEPRG